MNTLIGFANINFNDQHSTSNSSVVLSQCQILSSSTNSGYLCPTVYLSISKQNPNAYLHFYIVTRLFLAFGWLGSKSFPHFFICHFSHSSQLTKHLELAKPWSNKASSQFCTCSCPYNPYKCITYGIIHSFHHNYNNFPSGFAPKEFTISSQEIAKLLLVFSLYFVGYGSI